MKNESWNNPVFRVSLFFFLIYKTWGLGIVTSRKWFQLLGNKSVPSLPHSVASSDFHFTLSSSHTELGWLQNQPYLASCSLWLCFIPASPYQLEYSHINFSITPSLSHIKNASGTGSLASGLCLHVSLSVMLSLLSLTLLAFLNSFPDLIFLPSTYTHLIYYLLSCLIIYYVSPWYNVSSLRIRIFFFLVHCSVHRAWKDIWHVIGTPYIHVEFKYNYGWVI